ncbi:MAG: hypothetical protein MPJ24_04120 [Pirellulaceae bacterium]|nr:hypothetical protein [Pirellulaceae bacterium]
MKRSWIQVGLATLVVGLTSFAIYQAQTSGSLWGTGSETNNQNKIVSETGGGGTPALAGDSQLASQEPSENPVQNTFPSDGFLGGSDDYTTNSSVRALPKQNPWGDTSTTLSAGTTQTIDRTNWQTEQSNGLFIQDSQGSTEENTQNQKAPPTDPFGTFNAGAAQQEIAQGGGQAFPPQNLETLTDTSTQSATPPATLVNLDSSTFENKAGVQNGHSDRAMLDQQALAQTQISKTESTFGQMAAQKNTLNNHTFEETVTMGGVAAQGGQAINNGGLQNQNFQAEQQYQNQYQDQYQRGVLSQNVTQYQQPPYETHSLQNTSYNPNDLSGAFGKGNSTLGHGMASSNLGSGLPGAKHLEGQQTPSLVVEKILPSEIQVGKEAQFVILIQNTGQTAAQGVVLQDQIPKGVKFTSAVPKPHQVVGGQLQWELGEIKPNEEARITLNYEPQLEGEIGSVATVSFKTEASATTVCTRPQLDLEVNLPDQVLIGENVKISITLKNPGTGAATGVVIEEEVPHGLAHQSGRELEYEVGTLEPGQTKELELILKAERAGKIQNRLVARADADLLVESTNNMEVIAPQLQLGTTGPSIRYLQRQATYEVTIANPGTATAKNIELVSHLPKGMKFISSNNQGEYDPATHSVYWSLVELPAKEQGTVEMTVLPTETGEQKIHTESKADLAAFADYEKLVRVESIAEVAFDVADTADPIEVGKETLYEIRLINNGTKTATNVKVAAILPTGMQPIGGDGPTKTGLSGQAIQFEVLPRLAPKEAVVFKVQAKGLAAGEQRIQVQVVSDDLNTPVIKEEITRVYSDR